MSSRPRRSAVVFSTPLEQFRRRLHLGHVGVGHLLDLVHALGGVFGALDGALGEHLGQAVQVLHGLRHPQADQRVAATQVVVEKGEGRAHGEAVEPQGDLGQLYGQRVLVDAVDAALEDHAADDGLVGELGLVEDPVRFGRPPQDLLADRGHPPDQRRRVLAVEPLRDGGDVFDQLGDVVGEEVHGGDQEVAAAHGRVQDLEVQHRLGRIEPEQLGLALRLRPAVALEGVGLLLEGLETLLGQRLQRALDDEVDQLLGRVEAAAVLARVRVGADLDAVAAADRLALEEALVDRAELLHRHVAVVDEVALALRRPWRG